MEREPLPLEWGMAVCVGGWVSVCQCVGGVYMNGWSECGVFLFYLWLLHVVVLLDCFLLFLWLVVGRQQKAKDTEGQGKKSSLACCVCICVCG